jgi:hypothetical protein
MTQVSLYWRTKYGSLVERQAGPDKDGWMTVMRLSDGAVLEWNVSDMQPVSDEEVLAEARKICQTEAIREQAH